MNCEEVLALLAANVDGEVDRLRSHAIARHVAGCATCGPRDQAARALQGRLRAELGYHRAPAALRERMRAAHADSALRPLPAASVLGARWRWFGSGIVTGGLLAGVLWSAAMLWQPQGLAEDLSSQVVGLHTRATLGNHLIEVASSDRHTVRPWLSARLDYAVPVNDWRAAGFPLSGARIDRLEGRPVAALVYRRRDHVIDVFVRPAGPRASVPATRTVRGFNVAAALGAEMEWVAASDLSTAELSAFVQGLAIGKVDGPIE